LSFSVDVNILIYASDRGSPFHERAQAFLSAKAKDRELFCIAWTTAMAYVRIVTHAGILDSPLTPAEALTNIASLEQLPHVRMLTEKEGFLAAYQEVIGEDPVRGKLVPDAHLAAILRQHGVRALYTNDTDFRRFPWLEVRNPLAP
jgi:uncharacterized protein